MVPSPTGDDCSPRRIAPRPWICGTEHSARRGTGSAGRLRLRPGSSADSLMTSSGRSWTGSAARQHHPGGLPAGLHRDHQQTTIYALTEQGCAARRPVHPNTKAAGWRRSWRSGGAAMRRNDRAALAGVETRDCSSRCASCSTTPSSSISATCPRPPSSGTTTSRVDRLHPISASPRSPMRRGGGIRAGLHLHPWMAGSEDRSAHTDYIGVRRNSASVGSPSCC